MYSFDLSQLNGWGWVYLVLFALGIVWSLYRLTVGEKPSSAVRGGVAAITPFVMLVFLAVPLVPWFLAAKYPLNWAGWLYVAYAVVIFIIALVRNFAGTAGKPPRTGAGLWLRVIRQLVLNAVFLGLFFVATGVLSYGGAA